MQNNRLQKAIYISFLKAINTVGMKEFKKSTLFGRNDEVENVKQIERDAA